MSHEPYKTFEQVRVCVPIVHVTMKAGGSAEDCVVALANHNREIYRRLELLEQIAPKKIRTPDGKIYVWHCPEELIPEQP